DNNIYPADSSDLSANGFNFSENMCFTKFHLHNGGMTVVDFTEGAHPISTKGTIEISGAKRRNDL
ncbi:MAG: hypothetical protein ACE10H_05835, partial [Candidatus Binatia bacterium]